MHNHHATDQTLRLLNLGCGGHFHDAWVNLDVAPSGPSVLRFDLQEGIPFEAGAFDAVYSSHMLEHLPRSLAPGLIEECFRVLRPGGIIRLVVPDLEIICRLYVRLLDQALTGDREAAERYEWIVVELLDQLVRHESGGEMLRYWLRDPMPASGFVRERVGRDAFGVIEKVRQGSIRPPSLTGRPPSPETIGRFRASGEVHQWMYDRFSLGNLLAAAGFAGATVCGAAQSAIPGFAGYHLDTLPDGEVRKPDSLFMEAHKP